MPEGRIPDEILFLFEQAAPFDEFQSFGIFPGNLIEEPISNDEIEELMLEEIH